MCQIPYVFTYLAEAIVVKARCKGMNNNWKNNKMVQKEQEHACFSSKKIIKAVLAALGIAGIKSSVYITYSVEGRLLRVRVSDHGVNLSTWYRNMQGQIVHLDESDNIAFTFLPNKEECMSLRIKYPPKAINKTQVFSDIRSRTPIEDDFTVTHYVYRSWRIDEETLSCLIYGIVTYTETGRYSDPLCNTSAKATVFMDKSNHPPERQRSGG